MLILTVLKILHICTYTERIETVQMSMLSDIFSNLHLQNSV